MSTYAKQTLSHLLHQPHLKNRIVFVDDSFLEIVRWTIGISSLVLDYEFDNVVRLEDVVVRGEGGEGGGGEGGGGGGGDGVGGR